MALAVLHYILQKNNWEESEVAFSACPFLPVFHAVSPSPGLVKLLAPTFRHCVDHLVIRVSPDNSASFFLNFWYCHRCVLPYDRMRALVTGISNPMTALRRSSSSLCAPSMTWLRNGSLVFDSLDLGGLICLWICLINSFIVLAFDDECLCFLTTLDLSVSCSFSWLKGERPGTRALAACSQKKSVAATRWSTVL